MQPTEFDMSPTIRIIQVINASLQWSQQQLPKVLEGLTTPKPTGALDITGKGQEKLNNSMEHVT